MCQLTRFKCLLKRLTIQCDLIMGDIPSFEQLSVPIMTREKFSQCIGLDFGVFRNQCDRGYWPLVHVGKRVFVNVEAVRRQMLEKAFV